MWFLKTILALVLLWAALSGKFDLLHFGVGVVAAICIAASMYSSRPTQDIAISRFLSFLPWLLWQILVSNLRIAWLVLRVRQRIEPTFVRVAPGVSGASALTLLGCSITLTPGTLTVDIDENEMVIHALDVASAEDIRAGTMSDRVRKVFAVSGV